MLYHTGIFAIDTPDGAASYVIDGGLVTGSLEEIRQAISQLQEERLGTFGSSYEATDPIRIHNEVRISSENLERVYVATHTLAAAMAVSDGNSWLLPGYDIDLKEVNGDGLPFLLSRQMQGPVQLAAAVSANESLHYAVHRLALS
jgi:hypothetical protein